jgi:hypothetical protein
VTSREASASHRLVELSSFNRATPVWLCRVSREEPPMMKLNTAVAREVSAELTREGMKPKVLTFWLGIGERKASALCKGEAVWTMVDLELVAEGMGVDLAELVSRCATRIRT